MENNTNEGQPTDKVCQNWQVGKNLGTCIQGMYDSKLWTDVKFRCKDHNEGERTHAHKIILAARSPVFQELFYGSRAENKDELELLDIQKETFDMFLRYVYTDTVMLEEGTVLAVLLIADRYQVTSLAKSCEDYLSTIITKKNACKFLGIALCQNLTSLREACCSFIDQNANDVLNSEGFMELSKDSLLHILKGDTFYAEEDAIFLKAEEWAIKRIEESGLERNGATIKQILSEAFYYLRLPAMTYKMLMTCTRNKGYFSAEEYLDMADYINGLPDTRILTNSCVTRVPGFEKLLLKKIIQNVNQITDHIYCSLRVSVSKDTELVSFGLSNIEPYLEFDPRYYVKKGYRKPMHISRTSTVDRLGNYTGKVIEVVDTYENIEIVEYDQIHGLDLKKRVRLNMNVRIECRKLHFDQEFSFDSLRDEDEQIYLNPPVILHKTDYPYDFSVSISTSSNFSYRSSDSKVKMKLQSCKEECVKSKTGHAIFEGCFDGIKSITIKNFANRDTEF